MSHTIKLQDKEFKDLQELQGPRETYNDVINRLLAMWRALRGIEPIIRGNKAYQEFKDRDKGGEV